MGGARRTFRSDNNAGMCPEALAALQEANSAGHATGYGDDAWTAEAVAQFRRIFGEETAVFFVATGTIANVLSIACLTEGWQRIICHSHSHLNDDESTAPELFTGCRVTTVEKRESKLTAEDVERAASVGRGDVHQPQAGVVSVSNPTEFGEVYSPEEMRAICEVAHARGYRVHVDGARFANAVAHLKCDPKAISCDAGV
ncbi:MAG: aminotransferase class I/II-fold pyridoxal phosphate-dependent enzyme, partial [Planctomycetota bacterium]|nr:aminotransferase class I/II-fold pyridoxal phosphate-dependent enzyme [Planctomycetota bacterium]